MSFSMIAKAAGLKPEIRLAQSLSEFEASLSDEHKATFRSSRSQSLNKPPDPSDVMRLTAEIDRQVVQQNRGGQCFGPRLTNILQAVQQYAALGDVIIGGSQNIIACGVWSLLRLTLLTLVCFSSHMEKLSKLLMVAGRKAPRYEQMALLYPRSSDLRSCLSEYFIVVVQLCHQLYRSTQKRTVGSYFSFLGDLDLKEHEANLQLWGDCIRDEVTLLGARKITEQSTFLEKISKNAEHESHRKRLRARLRILDACSTYDHQTTWKEIRKSGTSTLLARLDQYPEWKAATTSSTLLCTGKLGVGKSVLLANMVDELNLTTEPAGTAVIYFFCRHDIQESLRARTVIGCIARQLISTVLDRLPDEFRDSSSISSLDDLLEFVVRMVPSTMKAILVLDGLDECADKESATILQHLKRLQEAFTFGICCAFRSDVHLKGALESAETLLDSRAAQLPNENPDISTFVTAELERCRESGRLCTDDSTLISEIQHTLVNRAQGMFLWVILQIASLCTAQSDEEILEALEDLPRGLPETFSRILQRSRSEGEKYQKLILQLCIIARRPLTTEELREALSVVPYNTDWNPARLVNNILSVLSFCGSLITIDEENLTVRFLHHSVKQYLLGQFDFVDDPILTLKDANQMMGEVIVTYLSYNTFETAVSRTIFPEIMARNMPSDIVKSAFRHSTHVRHAAIKMFKVRQAHQYDLRDTLIRARNATSQNIQFEFRAYAEESWLSHIQWMFDHSDTRALSLLMTMLEKRRVDINDKDDFGNRILFLAMGSASSEVIKRLLDYGSDIHDVSVDGCTALHMAAYWDKKDIIMCLLDSGAKIEAIHSSGMTPLLVAASEGQQTATKCLLESGANIQASSHEGLSALSLAAYRGHEDTVRYLVDQGANSKHRDKDDCTPLLLAAARGHRPAAQILMSGALSDLEARDKLGRTAASEAASRGHQDILEDLRSRGADLESRDNTGLTPLLQSAKAGQTHIVEFLLDRGAELEARDNNGWTALLWAAHEGHNGVTCTLMDRNANIKARGKDGWTPWLLAVARRHLTVFQSLKVDTQQIEEDEGDGLTPLLRTANEGNILMTKKLLQIGANIHAKDFRFGRTALHLSADRGHFEMMQFMLENGINVHEKNWNGESALHISAARGRPDMVQLLLKHGARVRDRASEGMMTALQLSAINGHVQVVKCLVDNGAIVGIKDVDGETALSLASNKGHDDVVRYLLDHAAMKLRRAMAESVARSMEDTADP